jgi:hypothetical protein
VGDGPAPARGRAGGDRARDVNHGRRRDSRAFPELFPDESSYAENLAASEANVALFLSTVERGGDPAADMTVPEEGVAFMREAVRRGVPLAAVLRSLRLGHEALLAITFASASERVADPAELARAVDLLSAWTFAFIDVISSLAEELHSAERDRWLRSAAATQKDTVERVLAGEQLDLGAATLTLGYELARWHVALVAWLERPAPGHEPFASLELAIADLAAGAGATRTLLLSRGMLVAIAWLGSTAPLDDAVLDALRFEPTLVPGVRLAIGEPAHGAAGFRTSHDQAAEARRVATIAGRRPGTVTRFRHVALAALATVDQERARTFVADQLGPLVGTDELSLRLAATLQAFLDEGASHGRAAKRLGVHENTVRYRVRQAEELLGRSGRPRLIGSPMPRTGRDSRTRRSAGSRPPRGPPCRAPSRWRSRARTTDPQAGCATAAGRLAA